MAHRFVDHTGEVELHVEAASEEAVLAGSTSSCTSRRWTGSSPPASSNEGSPRRPFAYKDVDAIMDVVVRAGHARRVARLPPIGVVKR